MVAEAVEQGSTQLLIADDLDPLGECEFDVDDRGTPLVAVGEQVEEQLAAGPVEGHEAEFVEDQKGDPQAAQAQAGERALVAGLDQVAHEVGDADRGDRMAAPDGFDFPTPTTRPRSH